MKSDYKKIGAFGSTLMFFAGAIALDVSMWFALTVDSVYTAKIDNKQLFVWAIAKSFFMIVSYLSLLYLMAIRNAPSDK